MLPSWRRTGDKNTKMAHFEILTRKFDLASDGAYDESMTDYLYYERIRYTFSQ